MPSTYAHYQFGLQVRILLPSSIQELLYQEKQLYEIGLHGPDLLFYYHPLFSNPISAVGFSLHEQPAVSFFERARERLLSTPDLNPSLAYILGFLCHFVLDSSCHPYIEETIRTTGIPHTEIEMEFDRWLLEMAGYDPLRQCLTKHIQPSLFNAGCIAPFFPGVEIPEVYKALRSMVFYNRLLLAPSAWKRQLIFLLMRLTRNYPEMHGMVMSRTPNPACRDSTEELLSRYDRAVPLAVSLITQYVDSLKTGEPLSHVYQHTFGAK